MNLPSEQRFDGKTGLTENFTWNDADAGMARFEKNYIDCAQGSKLKFASTHSCLAA